MINTKPINKEIIWGGGILSIYIFWALGWFIFSNFIGGSWDIPFFPLSDIKRELVPPFSQGYFLGTDLYGRSLFQVLSAGLCYSLGIGLTISFFSAGIGIIINHNNIFVGVTTTLHGLKTRD